MKWISQILVPAAVLLAQLGRAADPLSIWEQRDSGTNGSLVLTGVAYGRGQFVAAGSAFNSGNYTAVLVTSFDGLDWNQLEYSTNANVILGIVFGGDDFVAVQFTNGSGVGTIITSPDGNTWSPRYAVVGAALNGVVYAEGLIVAAGSKLGESVIITSPGGGVWTTRSAGSAGWLNAIAYGNGHFVAVGLTGAITESQSVVRLESDWSLSSGDVQFKLTGPSGQNCLIQASTDFIVWDPLTNAVLNNGSARFADPSASNLSARFYRAVLQ